MSLYAITKLSADKEGWLIEATWREADGRTNSYVSGEQRVLPADINRAIERGDSVNLIATSPAGWIIANEVLEHVTKDGRPVIRVHPQGDDAPLRVERY